MVSAHVNDGFASGKELSSKVDVFHQRENPSPIAEMKDMKDLLKIRFHYTEKLLLLAKDIENGYR